MIVGSSQKVFGLHGYSPAGDGFADKEMKMALTRNVRSGIGARLDDARQGIRSNMKHFNGVEPTARTTVLLHPDEPLDGIVQGDLLSEVDGACCSLEEGLPFLGVAEAVGEDNLSRVSVSVYTRGCFHGRPEGLGPDSRRGTPVYAELGKRTQRLNVLGKGVLIGALYAVESLERGTALICFKASDDEEPFLNARSEGGPLR